MRLPLPEPARDPAVFSPMFERGMERYPERRKNSLLAKAGPRKATAQAMPTMLDIEPTSRCNYRCEMCVVKTWKSGTRAPDMTLKTFRQILDAQYGVSEVKLQGLGEPLLNRELCAMVALCTERDIWTRTTVNGSLLHLHDNARRLLEAGIGEIQVSFDGADKQVYEGIRRGGNFERFVKNCQLLNRLAASMRPVAASRACVLVQKANAHQLGDIIPLCASLGFQRVTFSLNVGWFGVEELKHANQERDVSRELSLERCHGLVETGDRLGVDVTFWQGGNKYRSDAPEKLCGWLWGRAFIGSDRRIVPCCVISDPRLMDMGDAGHFHVQWNGANYQTFRRAHLDGAIPEICRHCYA